MQESVVLIRWLASVCWRESMKDGTRHNRLRAAVFVGLNEMRKAFSRAGPILSQESCRIAEKYNSMYHSSLNSLANESIQHGKLLWKIRPKFHQLDHLVLDCATLSNPLRVANYQEEDMVCRLKRMALACHPANLGQSVLERWSWHAGLEVCFPRLSPSTQEPSKMLSHTSCLLETDHAHFRVLKPFVLNQKSHGSKHALSFLRRFQFDALQI